MVTKRVLVIGAYGLIGAEIVRAARRQGHDVTGLVRDAALAERLLPGVSSIQADIAALLTPDAWRSALTGIEVVVNASGALQSGLRDDVARVQDSAIAALIEACEQYNISTIVQISAPGAVEGASTEFLRSKARADMRLRSSALQWVIFKPGLVISRTAYGGTALIRALAGFPLVLPIVLPHVRIQTVSVEDVAMAVCAAIESSVGANAEYDLVEDEAHSLLDIVREFRRWMGLPHAPVLQLPQWFGAIAAGFADGAGWLGWRSPLRSTALKVLQDDVIGDSEPWKAVSGRSLCSFEETLDAIPATLQERVFAKVQLLVPLIVLVLSGFFISSGVIAIGLVDAAAKILDGAVGAHLSQPLVLGGAILDISLGAAILVRRWTKIAAGLMIALSIAYLVSGTVMTPHLWLDPLGPFVKVLPAMCLALCAMLLIEER